MPLHRVWETVDAEPAMFDTVIIDEASQAGVESLALLLLARRIIVVGDDKQNSPGAEFVLEVDIDRLARQHLADFQFLNEFRPDTSLYDHAYRSVRNPISLREHFRCVPEIIRFSNELCYRDSPLVPLRQPPADRLPPLKSTFIDRGSCNGEGQRITNRAEAEDIVEAVQACIADDAYRDKSIGVIVLQGHAQAELIERMLAEVLQPKVREERKLRCGVPATFQGDERDVIFLSLVVAPNHRYRALTGGADQRRFNVAMSRAKDQVWLFHSVKEHDLSREDLRWRLLNFIYGRGLEPEVYEEIERLEREAMRKPRIRGEQPPPYDSWFEVDVALELLRRSYRVRSQWKVAEKSIDLVVQGLANRLAVECYGDAWHGPEEYEHDLNRLRQLERGGRWTFVIIREAEFYTDRSRAIQPVLEECERLGIYPADQYEESPSVESRMAASGPASVEMGHEATPRTDEEQTGTDADAQANPVSSDELGQAVQDSEAGKERPAPEDQPPPESRATAILGAVISNSRMKGNASGSQDSYTPLSDYEAYDGPPEIDPRSANPNAVAEGLIRIIAVEGPVIAKRVYDIYLRGCGIKRMGNEIKRTMNNALAHAIRKGRVESEDETGEGGLLFSVVRLMGTTPVIQRRRGPRTFEEIPPSELQLLAMYLVERHGFASGSKEHLRAMLEVLDLKRLTTPVETRFKQILKTSNAYVDGFLRSLHD